MTAVPIEILLVEDNPGDVRLTKEALRDARVRNNLSVAMDGVDALAFLQREGKHAAAPRPDLILLDLNLPKKNGRELLEEIKGDEKLTCGIHALAASANRAASPLARRESRPDR